MSGHGSGGPEFVLVPSPPKSVIHTKSLFIPGIFMIAIRIPITNYCGGEDYTASVLVGSHQAPVNVILDTGSSTLVVKQAAYKPTADLQPTSFVQGITCGTGGWAGPLVTTNLAMGMAWDTVAIADGSLALTVAQAPDNFGLRDGILGPAYDTLNDAFSLAGYLGTKGANPAVTWPWPLAVRNSVRRMFPAW
jgi:hypothetical protein